MSIRSFTVFMLLTLFAAASFADKIKVISTTDAPCSLSYSQGMQFSDLVFVAGQIPRQVNSPPDPPEPCPPANLPATTDVTDVTGSITDQTMQVMENIKDILAAAKLDFCDVVMATVYLATLDDFGAFNTAYKKYFDSCGKEAPANPVLPARASVGGVQIPGNPLFKIEISVIAVKQKGK